MEYTPPQTGIYESGLTVRLFYDVLDSLSKRHIPAEELERLKMTPHVHPATLWDRPAIRGELEEFVRSYFFTDLNEPLNGFGEIFQPDAQTVKGNLANYKDRLEQHYGSREQADVAIAELFTKLKKRVTRFTNRIGKIQHIEGDYMIKKAVRDALGNTSPIYAWIQLAMRKT